MGKKGDAFKKTDGSFLTKTSLPDPDARLGRRKRAKQKAEQDQGELAAEKRPRLQSRWMDEERKKTQLPKMGENEGGSRQPPKGKEAADDDAAPGRKKAKRAEKLQAKKAQKQQKQVEAAKKAHTAAADAVKGKAQDGKVSKAAQELIERMRQAGGGAAAEKRLLAVAAERISADPEKDIDMFDVFFELQRTGADGEVKLMALLSAIAVFKDLVPAYRIREPSEQEKAQVRSKPVLALERYELKLLQTYRRLLPELEASMRRHPVAVAPALAALVRAASDFNYRQRLIGTAVRHANSSDPDVRMPVVEGLSEMVEGDQKLEACRELVLAVGRVAQATASSRKAGGGSRGPHGGEGLQHELLKVLLRLPVGIADKAALQAPRGDMSTADDEVRRGLAEASITQTPEQLRKAEAELLYEVFVVYLRVLRQRHLHSRDLLAAVLTGLARWGQQVNLELLLEILSELRLTVKDAISRTDELVALQGLNCALVLLSGPSQALNTDITWLSDAMTSALGLALPSLYSTHSEGAAWPPPKCFYMGDAGVVETSEKELSEAMELASVPTLVLRVLEAALKCPQGYSNASDAALAALLEMLYSIAISADLHVGFAFLREASLLLRRYRRLHTLLDMEGGIFGLGGITDRAVTLVWHMQPLTCSLAPHVVKAAKALPAAIPRRNELIGDLFPLKDARSWLSSEVARHVSAIGSAAAPQKHRGKASRTAFATEAELRASCGEQI
mmetsp:Transcript_59311/g.105434  ORF Transcript_59311/g.105434 Transcript_59311/m.105434 type:complete len:733 (-) Transcript_59311:85-2283(-)|eukprot:CAMPEP_0197637878 /NCGR_PEP_ID=MMETSP1338-20131121/12970_1 /TAXON_ID=43686 ORGANISM="Pelagodinium beii, Strain RCC1491" /NCGR_SAMPLE_ID=MMETSP1338 /ASSEMBLY_ACC=CAM_ASM_000754 /LENGTH=732 /DNA_ID=CAMNT_0043210365 /DNA_START=25 /DNA_END=2223 /DNA_ORIENTATION=+